MSADPAVVPAVPTGAPNVVDVETVAAALGLSTRTVRRLCEDGLIPARRLPRARVWVIAGDYLRFTELSEVGQLDVPSGSDEK